MTDQPGVYAGEYKGTLSGCLQGLFLFLISGRFLMTHFGKKQITAIFLPGSLNPGVRILSANLTVIFS
jgi:hypothetical protein